MSVEPQPSRILPWLFGTAVFLSASLLFQVQPIVAKGITPRFGGSAMVWTTCMLFFQGALLGGYLYADRLTRLRLPWQAVIHVALLASTFTVLELVPPVRTTAEESHQHPVADLLRLLAGGIGPTFLLLSATAPLLQRWYAVTVLRTPYWLYALSNAGSLIGLLSYPFVVEPALSLEAQERLWTGGLVVLCLLFGAVAASLPQTANGTESTTPAGERQISSTQPAGWGLWVMWLVLSAVPSALLLAVTNQISVEVAPVPLLWIVPLCLYLITFILCFEGRGWYQPRLTLLLAVASLVISGLFLRQPSPPIVGVTLALYSAMFFCMLLCHGELAARKPEPQFLTGYFLTMSAGGVVGGLLVAVGAPLYLTGYYESPLSLGAALAVFVLSQVEQNALRSPPASEPIEVLTRSWIARLRLSWLAVVAICAVVCWLSPELLTWAQRPAFATDWPAAAWFGLLVAGLVAAVTGWGVAARNRLRYPASGMVVVFAAAGLGLVLFAAVPLGRMLGESLGERVPIELLSAANPLVLWAVVFFALWQRASPDLTVSQTAGQSTDLTPDQPAAIGSGQMQQAPPWGILALAGLVGFSAGLLPGRPATGVSLVAERNFYGTLRVEDWGGERPQRVLLHGQVLHGSQRLTGESPPAPTTYYHAQAGVGLLLSQPSTAGRRVGLVGLGVGTLAAYGRTGDRFQFFEINSAVLRLAEQYFDFLKSSPAEISHVIADGRLALEHSDERYDVLVIDAFSGDAIPAHLLTEEAISLYFRRLSPGGVLALHLSNNHLDLTPVVNQHAESQQLHLKYVVFEQTADYPRSLWALLSREAIGIAGTESSPIISRRKVRWTDSRHSLLPLIRTER